MKKIGKDIHKNMIEKPTISLIAAIGENRELGKNNKLLWRLPADLARFRKLTIHHPIIMGRKTYESIGKALPRRINIVISHEKRVLPDAVCVCSFEEALHVARRHEKNEIFVIGGAQIYQAALPYADKLHLTIIHETCKDADVFFPDYSAFNNVLSQKKERDAKYSYTFMELTKS